MLRIPRVCGIASRGLARTYAAYHKPVGGASDFQVPNYSEDIKADRNTAVNRNFSYFMIGTFGVLGAATARATVQDFLSTMSASKDVLAMAKVEVDLSKIPEAKNIVVKWRGKPIFIRHRTQEEIDEANEVDVSKLRDPETDSQRTKDPHWLVMIGICTHLGCVPIGESGEFGGWFCPCHGSHYDISGRIRKGPAPLNLEIPEYSFEDDESRLIIG